jgi:hypothetical protein
MGFYIGQRVRVYPQTTLLKECAGFAGHICSVEEEEGCLLYRVRFDAFRGDGYLCYDHELKNGVEGAAPDG